jgi:HAE1 family hydrophobic/amphiphilic exporter-1
MTTTTTVFGLIPLVLFPGAGSELYRGLGAVVLGGLLISTVFTLLLTPVLFSLLLSAVAALRSWLRWDDSA